MSPRDIIRLRNVRSCSICGHDRMEALVATDPVLCSRCHAIARGVSTIEDHHIAGLANLPWTIPLDINDHRVINALQRRWPKRTLRNLEGDDRLRAAGLYRGVSDLLVLSALDLEDACGR